MRRKNQKLTLHQKIHHHLRKHFHKHIQKVLHFSNHLHHNLLHVGELVVISLVTISSGSLLFANLTGYSEELYRNNSNETAEALLDAMQNPGASLKQGNIISIWDMRMDIENTFAKGYCTYGAARVSPEFFPFIDEKTQQRTWGGNAVDRCKNASDTGYKIGSTPIQGALVVYDAGGRFGVYGHVGKVLHYDKSMKKIIVRDMARVARGKMSDRWEDLTTAQVKCYIYNNKNTTPSTIHIPPVINTGNIITSNIVPEITIPTTTQITPSTLTSATIPVVVTPTISTKPVTAQPNTLIVMPQQDIINKTVSLELDNLSDIAQHFLTQNNLTATLTSKSPLNIGEIATLTLNIKNKSGEPYSGLLPFAFSILSTHDILQPDISTLKLVNDGKVDISILAKKIGTATIIITMDETKIGEFILEVK